MRWAAGCEVGCFICRRTAMVPRMASWMWACVRAIDRVRPDCATGCRRALGWRARHPGRVADVSSVVESRVRAMLVEWVLARQASGAAVFTYSELARVDFGGLSERAIDRQRGICRPKGFRAALSIRTTYTQSGKDAPYDDRGSGHERTSWRRWTGRCCVTACRTCTTNPWRYYPPARQTSPTQPGWSSVGSSSAVPREAGSRAPGVRA